MVVFLEGGFKHLYEISIILLLFFLCVALYSNCHVEVECRLNGNKESGNPFKGIVTIFFTGRESDAGRDKANLR